MGGAVYLLDLQIELQYQNSTNVPATCEIRDTDGTTVIRSFKTLRAIDTNNKVITRFQFVQTISASNLGLRVYLVNTSNVAAIGDNTSLFAQRLV